MQTESRMANRAVADSASGAARIPDPEFEKHLDRDLHKLDNNARSLARYVAKMEANEEKRARKEGEKNEKAAGKLEAKLGDARPPRGPVKPLPIPCTGKAGQGPCTCSNGSKSVNGCVSAPPPAPEIAFLTCPDGEREFGVSGVCRPVRKSGFGRGECNQLAELLRQLEAREDLLEEVKSRACSNDPNGAECSQLTSEDYSLFKSIVNVRVRYEPCVQ